jgi:hypothetical protein
MLLNIASMNYLPVMERWLLQTHVPESVARIGPWLRRYHSYRAVPPPPEMHADAEAYGYYNWRVTELWHEAMFFQEGLLPQGFFADYKHILGLPTDVADADTWHGGSDLRQAARCVVPARATEDFLGADKPLADYRSILRWFVVFKLPAGVPADEADDWYINTHAKEVLGQPDLTRFISHRAVPSGRSWDWYRISELWYEDFDGWRNSTIATPPDYTPPPWDSHKTYPFFEPYKDFVSTFLLEAPTNHVLPAHGGYVFGV